MILGVKFSKRSVELSDNNTKFKFIKVVNNTFEDTLPKLSDLNLTEPYTSEMEGHEYGYAIFELLPDINISNKSIHISSLTVTCIEANNNDNMMVD